MIIETAETAETRKQRVARMIQIHLAQCTGTEQWYQHFSGPLYTDGVKQLAELCKAHWLIDAIMSHQQSKAARDNHWQLWTLSVVNSEAVLTMQQDGGLPALIRQEIPYTDFPLDGETRLYFIDGVLLLPSEY
jgi:hypothetical protein